MLIVKRTANKKKMMRQTNAYPSLLRSPRHMVAESSKVYSCLTERHIQALWLEQKYFKFLQTSAGLPLRIISPGLWNAEAGPDFLQAHLVIGGTVVKGDVEIHLSESSWQHHQHHADPRYNNVVLHLCLWNPHKDSALYTQSKATFHRAYLESFLTVPPNRLLHLIDLELYPYKKFLGSGRCAKELFKNLPSEKTIALFHDAAFWRLSQKLHFIQAQSSNPRLWPGAGIAMGLGYKRNALAFLQLYLWLHGLNIDNEHEAFALCLQACGFFSAAYQTKWGQCAYYTSLLKEAPYIAEIPKLHINLLKVRPFNHPVRRLAFLAKLVTDPSHYYLAEKFFALWDQTWPSLINQKARAALRQHMSDIIPSYADPFFSRCYLFGSKPQNTHLPLVGESQKHSILINTFLPLLADKLRGQKAENSAFAGLYATFAAEDTGKTRYLAHRFFGDTPKSSLVKRADLEQGAYQIHKDFCMHYEASCEGCPFVSRYKNNYTQSI